jgi:two-component system, cell cycle response regulator DivK
MNKVILVVEDNAVNAELLCDWLEVEGYKPFVAASLSAATGLLNELQPDAVLLDIRLGPENGLSLLPGMRQCSELRDVPVIAVTAQAAADEHRQILESGCDAIVSKPIDFRLLKEQLHLHLNLMRTARGTSLARKA